MFDLSNAPFAFLDLKTTGLSPWFGDRICEVGIVLCEGRRIKETYQTLVNPERPLSLAAAQTNRFTDEQLSTAPRFDEIIDIVDAKLAGAIVVCHNARFDLQFLDSEYRRLGRELQIPNLIDTLILAREYFEAPSYKLSALANGLELPKMGAQRAFPDALTLRAVFFELMALLDLPDNRLDNYIGIYNSPAWPDESIILSTEFEEALANGNILQITYVNSDGQQSRRRVEPRQIVGLSDYIYLRAFCHLRGEERTFRLDRIVELEVEAA